MNRKRLGLWVSVHLSPLADDQRDPAGATGFPLSAAATIIEHMFPSSIPDSARECVAELDEIERLKAALCARQARLAARLDDTQRRTATSERAMATEVGLARHESPHRGARLLTLARALVDSHPELLALLESGDVNERRAELVVAETAHLALPDRCAADREIASLLVANPTWGDRTVTLEARRVVYRIDETAAVRLRERARQQRHVTARTQADGTGQVAGVVADYHVSAIMSSLNERADLLKQQGDERTRAQIIADLFVERLTGQVVALSTPVAIDLVMSAETLLADGCEPGEIPGVGPIPASIARKLVEASPEERTTVRRLFADTDHLIAMESTSRGFTGLLRLFVTLRDRRCRTPWCNAPIRHLDHVAEFADGGTTSEHNAQGLCESCNYAKEDPGITHQVISEDVIEAHTTRVTTPSGASYDSRAPSPPGADPRDRFIERRPGQWVCIA